MRVDYQEEAGLETHGPLTPARAWAVAITVTLVMAVSYVDRQTLAIISPTVCATLGIDHTRYGWLSGAFSLAYLAFAPAAGWIVDRLGCRKGLVFAVLAWSAVSALHAIAPSFGVLFALRIALGTAEAPSFPGAAQAVRRSLPMSSRSAAFGLLFTGSSLGAMIAAPLAVAMLAYGSWRTAFIGTATVGLLWVPLWLWVSGTPEARATLEVVPSTSDGPPKSREPWHALVRDPSVQRAVILVFASAPVLGFDLNWLPQYLVTTHGITQIQVAEYVWLPMLCFDVGAMGFGALASLRERRPGSLHASHVDLLGVAALGCSALALMPLAPGPWSAVLVASVAGAGGGGVFSLVTSDMLGRVSPMRVSMASGLTAAAQSLAFVIAFPLIGWSVDGTHAFTQSVVALGACVVPGAIAWIAWPVTAPRGA